MGKACLILRRCCLGGDLYFGFKHVSLVPFLLWHWYGTQATSFVTWTLTSPTFHDFMHAFVLAAVGCETLPYETSPVFSSYYRWLRLSGHTLSFYPSTHGLNLLPSNFEKDLPSAGLKDFAWRIAPGLASSLWKLHPAAAMYPSQIWCPSLQLSPFPQLKCSLYVTLKISCTNRC